MEPYLNRQHEMRMRAAERILSVEPAVEPSTKPMASEESSLSQKDLRKLIYNGNSKTPVVDDASAQLMELSEFWEMIGGVTTQLGAAMLQNDTLKLPTDLKLIHARQAAFKELSTNEELREHIERFLEDSKSFEYHSGQFLEFHTSAESYLSFVSAYSKLAQSIKALPVPKDPYLKILIEDLKSFTESRLGKLAEGPICRRYGELLPRSEVPRFSPATIPFWPNAPMGPYAMSALLAGTQLVAVSFALPEVLRLPAMVLGSAALMMGMMTFGAGVKRFYDKSTFLEPLTEQLNNDRDFKRFLVSSAKLDEMNALVTWAENLPVSCLHEMPKVIETPQHMFKGLKLRNPIIVAQGRDCIPNDIELNEHSLTILTGPNSGGKTTICKTLLLNQILAQLGAPVLGLGVTLSPAKQICYQGPQNNNLQDREGQLGTELGRAKDEIFLNATPHTLAVLDELARGTSREEGDDIAYRAVRTFEALGASTIWVTHNHAVAKKLVQEGAALALQGEFVKNKPTHIFIPGVVETSHAEEVVTNVGFPPKTEELDTYLAKYGKARHERKAV